MRIQGVPRDNLLPAYRNTVAGANPSAVDTFQRVLGDTTGRDSHEIALNALGRIGNIRQKQHNFAVVAGASAVGALASSVAMLTGHDAGMVGLVCSAAGFVGATVSHGKLNDKATIDRSFVDSLRGIEKSLLPKSN